MLLTNTTITLLNNKCASATTLTNTKAAKKYVPVRTLQQKQHFGTSSIFDLIVWQIEKQNINTQKLVLLTKYRKQINNLLNLLKSK